MGDSRVDKTIKNAKVNLFFYLLALVLSFYSRKVFLDNLGADFIGLIGTMLSMLGFINLAELGIGAAIGYTLYKPLFHKDREAINEIISIFRFLYRRIGLIILIVGSVVACCLPFFFASEQISMGVIYAVYFSYLGSALIGYYINYRQVLLGADQRNYIVVSCFQSVSIIKLIVQIVVAYVTSNLYLWVVIEFSFGIIYSLVLNINISRVYPWLNDSTYDAKSLLVKYPDILKNARRLFFQELGNVARFQFVPLIVYSSTSLTTVALFNNYNEITNKISSLINSVLGSDAASIGNLVAEGNRTKIVRTFWILTDVRYWMASLAFVSFYSFLSPTVRLWLGDEYLLSQYIVSLIALQCAMRYALGVTMQFLYAYGIFWDVWAPVVDMAVNVVCSLVLGCYWGLNGVLIGGIIGLFLVSGIWKPILLYHWGVKLPIVRYFLSSLYRVAIHSIPVIVCFITDRCFIVNCIIPDNECSIFLFLIHVLILVLLYSGVSIVFISLFLPSSASYIFTVFKGLLKK